MWPCPTARQELLARFHRDEIALAMTLGADLVVAAGDLPHLAAGELHYRFVGWVRETRAVGRAQPRNRL